MRWRKGPLHSRVCISKWCEAVCVLTQTCETALELDGHKGKDYDEDKDPYLDENYILSVVREGEAYKHYCKYQKSEVNDLASISFTIDTVMLNKYNMNNNINLDNMNKDELKNVREFLLNVIDEKLLESK